MVVRQCLTYEALKGTVPFLLTQKSGQSPGLHRLLSHRAMTIMPIVSAWGGIGRWRHAHASVGMAPSVTPSVGMGPECGRVALAGT